MLLASNAIFFSGSYDRIYTDRSRKSRAHDIMPKSDDAAI